MTQIASLQVILRGCFVFFFFVITLHSIFATHHLKYSNFPNPPFDTLTHHPFFNFKSCNWVSQKKKISPFVKHCGWVSQKKYIYIKKKISPFVKHCGWVWLQKCHWKLSFGNWKHLKCVFSFYNSSLKN